ncbi:BRO-N domain-containing protein [Roseicella aquatilis]|uniref:BRO domain-containing protein n=1 Tax=Roseicella aquatilis TaxID=2527868 RepID=A0A4R4DQP7_9PROT|nr:BRO family protein [Roseicella aquatilis]TCZ64454.1 BRO domain-containing protein [Roseicella aquatilis]
MDIFKFALDTGLAFDIRVFTVGKAPWFVAADVCKALGMSVERGTYQWLTGLGQDEKNTHRLATGFRGNPNVVCISESGLYKLILRSDKPQARQFQDWVTREVLPAIRKDGAYVMGEEKVRTGGGAVGCTDTPLGPPTP